MFHFLLDNRPEITIVMKWRSCLHESTRKDSLDIAFSLVPRYIMRKRNKNNACRSTKKWHRYQQCWNVSFLMHVTLLWNLP
mmetsp:Transcript_23989/g.57919  ORF Transcript_23989/g.57919 Transcript_23989/m.57919 type:complete len:81 (-) Transcript_23989:61-303(-)